MQHCACFSRHITCAAGSPSSMTMQISALNLAAVLYVSCGRQTLHAPADGLHRRHQLVFCRVSCGAQLQTLHVARLSAAAVLHVSAVQQLIGNRFSRMLLNRLQRVLLCNFCTTLPNFYLSFDANLQTGSSCHSAHLCFTT